MVAVFAAATAVAPGFATARDGVVSTIGASRRPAAGGILTRAGYYLTDYVLAGGGLYHSRLGHHLYGYIGPPPRDPARLAPKKLLHVQLRLCSERM